MLTWRGEARGEPICCVSARSRSQQLLGKQGDVGGREGGVYKLRWPEEGARG
ncbi:MAG: hypothetical protein Q8P67_17765 [archaeon]|nr:hypothetical protein [archaeon]